MSFPKLIASLRQRGLGPTLLTIACVLIARTGFARLFKRTLAYVFDLRHGTKTRGVVTLVHLHIDSKRKNLGTFYIATPGYEFRRVISSLAEEPDKYTFIDFGCGMGSVLLRALARNFRRVIGIEFSSHLAGIATANICKHNGVGVGSAQIIIGDAADFSIPLEPCVLWLFNPFTRTVTQEVVANIFRAYKSGNQQIYVIWYNLTPNAQPLFDAAWLEVIAGETRFPRSGPPPLLEIAELCLPFSIFRTRATTHASEASSQPAGLFGQTSR